MRGAALRCYQSEREVIMETALLLALAALLIIYASYQLAPQLYRRVLRVPFKTRTRGSELDVAVA
jgi:hypothetical protein